LISLGGLKIPWFPVAKEGIPADISNSVRVFVREVWPAEQLNRTMMPDFNGQVVLLQGNLKENST
jgi:hypothetical protein